MTRTLIAVNAGSSTLKFAAYRLEDGLLQVKGHIDHFGQPGTSLSLWNNQHELLDRHDLEGASQAEAVGLMISELNKFGLHADTVVHRVVHGGREYHNATLLTDQVLADLRALTPLAPLHQPASMAGIEAFGAVDRQLVQLACFDTAFHAHQPDVAIRFGLARHWHEEGVRRYGFHGLSYAAIARQFADIGLQDSKVVVCHLGNGASACAIQAGKSVASSMGFSAIDGLMMGTRPGYLDPEVVLYWVEHEGMSVAAIRNELYKKSGLLGVSGLSADMRTLLESDNPEAHEAVQLFCYRVSREVGSLAMAMQGIDAIVFTAGIGEHSAPVREAILRKVAWLGFEVDVEANQRQESRLTTHSSIKQAFMLETDEEGEMARQAAEWLKQNG